MTVRSRHLGEIVLVDDAHGAHLDTTTTVGDATVPLRLVIDAPERFDDDLVRNIDIAIDNLTALDEMARDTVAAGARREGTTAARSFRAWASEEAADPAEFARMLRPNRVTILPDGGPTSLDRVVFSYGLPESPALPPVTVRFLDGIGAELDAVARGGIG